MQFWISTTAVTTATMSNGQQLPTLDGAETLVRCLGARRVEWWCTRQRVCKHKHRAQAVTVDGSNITVGGSAILVPDTLASNGVLQLMASFMTAPNAQLPSQPLADVVDGRDELSTTATALVKAGLQTRFELDNSSYTLFAPTNAAWQALPPAVFDYLMGNPAALANVLLTHACTSRRYSTGLPYVGFLNMLNQQNINVQVSNGVIGLVIGSSVVANVSTSAGDYDIQVSVESSAGVVIQPRHARAPHCAAIAGSKRRAARDLCR